MRNPNSRKRAHNAPDFKDKCFKNVDGQTCFSLTKAVPAEQFILTFYLHTDGLDNVFDLVI